MSWLKRNKEKPSSEDIVVQPPTSSRISVELHKEASKEAKAMVDAANEHLNTLLVENGFTLKIYLATGGQHRKREK